MAIREGKCPNCGSLIQVNDREDASNFCLFCWAPVEAQQAFALAKDDSGHEYPNDTYDEPTDEERSSAMAGYRSGATDLVRQAIRRDQAERRRTEQTRKLTPAEIVAAQTKPIYVPNLSKKMRLWIGGVSLAIVVILCATLIPLTIVRNNHRGVLAAEIETIAGWKVDDDGSYLFEGQGNRSLSIVAPEKIVDEAEGQAIMERYLTAYRKSYGIPEDKPVALTLRILDSDGTRELKIDRDGGLTNNRITPPPLPTPTPTPPPTGTGG
ncbi:MAG: hypothetical protein GX900_01830 [Clostridiaceae bacterium]|nr:hypothetical protein [Clostridiaceae bacterium]